MIFQLKPTNSEMMSSAMREMVAADSMYYEDARAFGYDMSVARTEEFHTREGFIRRSEGRFPIAQTVAARMTDDEFVCFTYTGELPSWVDEE
jgi:hypothetical protein